jgi:LysR family glycine cleavage system transcriptional activator
MHETFSCVDAPNLLALLALAEVARHGSVTRAAAALHLTQSAVSHRLRAFERELGRPLLERAGRGVRLTAAARELAQAAGPAIEQLNVAIARAAPERSQNVLSISCAPSFAIRFLVPRLAAFRATHPQLDLRIAAADIAVDPPQGADAAVHLASHPTAHLWSDKLIDEVVFPVASPRLLASQPLRSLVDLGNHTLLFDEALADDRGHVGWPAWLAEAERLAGVTTKPRRSQRAAAATRSAKSSPPGVRFSHSYLALEAAVAGDGIAVARRTVVADDLARGRLVAPFGLAVPSGLSYWFVSAVEPERRSALARLHAFLRQQLTAAQVAADAARENALDLADRRALSRPRER